MVSLLDLDKKIIGIKHSLLKTPQNISDVKSLKPNLEPIRAQTKPPIAAAVLIALVRREGHYAVLYTERARGLRAHSGQIAFPGGKIDAEDKDAAAAAIREANEEVAIEPNEVEILGYMPTMFTGTNYLITPVVAIVKPSKPFVANEQEVSSFFEVPLSFLSQKTAYQPLKVWHANKEQITWQIKHQNRNIWGITAHITQHFWDLALRDIGKC